jgi:DNA-binding Xre family transcriptional regulator
MAKSGIIESFVPLHRGHRAALAAAESIGNAESVPDLARCFLRVVVCHSSTAGFATNIQGVQGMAQIDLMVTELKRRLKDRKLTYAGIARSLQISESSVKRMFARKNMSLHRFEQICNLLDLEISDVVSTMHDKRSYLTQLTPDQEAALAADTRLLLMAYLVIHGWQLDEIVAEYDIDERDAERLLIRLSKIKLIELLPFNRFKLRTARNFTWRPDGPVRKFFEEQIQREFLHDDFAAELSRFRFVAGRLSRAAIVQLQHAIERIGSEFDQLVERDSGLPRTNRPIYAAVFAIRPWEYSEFEHLKRDPSPAKRRG